MHRHNPYLCLVLVLGATLAQAGCALPPPRLAPAQPPHVVQAAVFAADGAGDFRVSSSMLRKVVVEDALPIDVVTFVWSHGYARVVADQIDWAHAQNQGQRLADEVMRYRAVHPDVAIHLWAHSAGAAVILSALENLPAGIVDQVILLAPSTSPWYDLRPALARVQCNMYVFCSRVDWFYMGLLMRLLGTSDRWHQPACAKLGYSLEPASSEDEALYHKLVHWQWHPRDRATGHDGGHFGSYHPQFLRRNIIPLLINPPPQAPLPSP